jgi:hypothetical protein
MRFGCVGTGVSVSGTRHSGRQRVVPCLKCTANVGFIQTGATRRRLRRAQHSKNVSITRSGNSAREPCRRHLANVLDLKIGEAIDRFRQNVACVPAALTWFAVTGAVVGNLKEPSCLSSFCATALKFFYMITGYYRPWPSSYSNCS